MTSSEKRGLVPKLRFPEFREAGEWEKKRLGDVGSVRMCKRILKEQTSPRGDIPFYKIGTFGGVPDAYISREIFENFRNGYPFPKNGAVLISAAGTIGRTVRYNGELAYFQDSNIVWLDNSENLISDSFLFYLYQLIDWSPSVGAIQRLYNENILGAQVKFPSIPEQQKIADCLASLDELITLEVQKLDTLQTHKKGLMQQLFPAEGKTLPKLRFPEFREAGEWEEKRLGDVCERIMDGTHFSPKSKFGPRAYLTSKNIQDGKIDLSNLSYISEEEHNEIFKRCPVKLNDVLLTKDGANTGNCAINDLAFEFSLLSSVAVLRGKPTLLDQRFLYQAILTDVTQRLIRESMSGQAITRITLEKIGNFSISIAGVEEQQRIADCLASLDDLITAQTQQLAALKTYKKGLMQQLFPVLDEVQE